jgi:hypothetical protein
MSELDETGPVEDTQDDMPVEDSAPVESSAAESVEAPVQAPQDQFLNAFRQVEEFKDMDERALAERLYSAYQQEQQATQALSQYQSVMPIAQEYLENRTQYEQWKASQNQPQVQQQQPVATPPQEKKGWWNPPELRDNHRRYIVKDANGRDMISPDAPLDAKAAIQDHFDYRANFAEKFLSNPQEALGPMVQEMAQQQAQSIVGEQMQQAAQQQYVQNVESANRDWLYDENGNVSAEGIVTKNAIEQASRLGISDPEARWQFALQAVEADLMRRTMSAQRGRTEQDAFTQALPVAAQPQEAVQAEPSQAEAALDYLRRAASRTPSRNGAQNNSPAEQRKGLSFQERLRIQAQEDGLI